MPIMTDDRIPLRFAAAEQAGPAEALLIEEGALALSSGQSGEQQRLRRQRAGGPLIPFLLAPQAIDIATGKWMGSKAPRPFAAGGLLVSSIAPLAQPVMRFRSVGVTARPGAAHVPGCVCCTGRGAAATALGDLFQARAVGRVAWFTGVVAVVSDPESVATEVQADRLAAARFRVLP